MICQTTFFVRNYFHQFLFGKVHAFDLKGKLVIEFLSAAFDFFRPPSARIGDGIENYARSLVY